MKYAMLILAFALLMQSAVAAHCDSETGPVAQAAQTALSSGNINAVLPYVQAAQENELTQVFRRTVAARSAGASAREVADRHFVETAVRLHRQGEGAAYTGLKPANTDFGPALPAAERALETRDGAPLQALLAAALSKSLNARLHEALELQQYPAAPATHDGVANARRRVRAELEFEKYADAIYRSIAGLPPESESPPGAGACAPGSADGLLRRLPGDLRRHVRLRV